MKQPAAHSHSTLNALHGVRAVSSLCVAALHLYAVEMLTSNSIMPKAMEFSRIGTDLLFVVSGAALVFASEKRARTPREGVSFMYDRVTRIMPLYWLITLVPVSLWLLSGHKVFSHLINNFEFWSTAFLIPNGHPPADPVAWSLTNLLFFYSIFAVTLSLPRRFEPAILAIWAAIVIGLRLSHADVWGSPFVRMVTHWSALEFICGVTIMRLALANCFLPSRVAMLITAAWIGFVLFVYGPTPSATVFNDENLRLLTLGPAALGVVCAAIASDFERRSRPNKILRFFGDISFPIYLTHVVTFAVIARLWTTFGPANESNDILKIIVMVVSMLLIGWVVHRFVELPLRKITHKAKPDILGWISERWCAALRLARRAPAAE